MNRRIEKAALVGITIAVHFVVVPAVMLYFGVRGKLSEVFGSCGCAGTHKRL